MLEHVIHSAADVGVGNGIDSMHMCTEQLEKRKEADIETLYLRPHLCLGLLGPSWQQSTSIVVTVTSLCKMTSILSYLRSSSSRWLEAILQQVFLWS